MTQHRSIPGIAGATASPISKPVIPSPKQGFLRSEWNAEEARPRKFYRTSPEGLRLADTLTAEWTALTSAITSLTAEDPTS